MLKFVAVVAAVVGLLSLSEGATIAENLSNPGPLRDLLDAAGLLDTLQNDGPYSLFVPSDLYLLRYLAAEGTSVSSLKQDVPALRNMLLYHVINGTVPIEQLYNERQLTSLNGKTIRVNNYADRRLTVQGTVLQARGRICSNGIIHYLYGPMEADNGTVADVIQSQSDLSTLLAAAQAAGLTEFLFDQSPITVFAPTNDAFKALGDKVQTLLANPTLLAEIIKYHVVPGTLYTAGIRPDDLHTFEDADKIHLGTRFGSTFTVDGGHLMRNGDDLSATNGVVHKIDKVLIPASLKDQI